MERTVTLREIDRGPDHFALWATLAEGGDLLIEGQDLGPGTAPVSSDGEYEYSYLIAADKLPSLCEVVGLPAGGDLVEHLAAEFSGEASWRLEDIIRSSGLAELTVI